MFAPLFHVGNLFLGTGFLVPHGQPFSYLLLRACLTLGHICLLVWSCLSVCSGETFLFQISFLLIHLAYFTFLTKKHFPVFVPKNLTEIYNKMFAPFKVTKKEFCQLVRDATTERFPAGKFFSLENETKIQPKLHLLMTGSLSAQSDGILLHKILPREFIDSVEWKAKQVDPLCRKFQVTIQADEDCQVLVFANHNLEKVYETTPKLNLILDSLVGKDITRKLYTTSDLANNIMNEKMASAKTLGGPSLSKGHLLHPTKTNASKYGDHKTRNIGSFKKILGFHRTLSTDAIHTGCKGMVRSKTWMTEAGIKAMDQDTVTDQVMVVNFELDIPPAMECLPHRTPIHTMDKEVLAEAQFLAQQRKYWPSGFI